MIACAHRGWLPRGSFLARADRFSRTVTPLRASFWCTSCFWQFDEWRDDLEAGVLRDVPLPGLSYMEHPTYDPPVTAAEQESYARLLAAIDQEALVRPEDHVQLLRTYTRHFPADAQYLSCALCGYADLAIRLRQRKWDVNEKVTAMIPYELSPAEVDASERRTSREHESTGQARTVQIRLSP